MQTINLYTPQSMNNEDIAIIGMSGRFPGSNNVLQFWENLCDGKESITFLSEEELKESGTPEGHLQNPSYIRAASLLDNIDRFDADFFDISPREAISMDPQHRFFLECAFEALLDGGYHAGKEPLNVGVFAGAGTATASYLLEYIKTHPEIQGLSANYHSWGIDKDYFTTRTSYKLNLTGPSFDVQTGCSTSLVAVHLACEAIQRNHCPLALAGGVSIRIPHKRGYFFSEGDVHSHDGRCRTFDAESSGTVFGSGLGIVLLKKYSEAIKDNDRIYAVIKGTFINNDGNDKASYPSPGHQGQFECISQGFLRANIDPETIQFMEAHGTGTIVGDPIEIRSLSRAFNSSRKGYCAIGSLKPNIGHLGAASGIASLIKLALSLFYKKMPAQINYKNPNPLIDFPNTPFYINNETKEWIQESMPRRGAINSFGVGGTNAFAILEEAMSGTKAPIHYPFQGKSYWIEPPSLNHHPLLGQKIDISLISEDKLYENVLNTDSYLKDHKIFQRILFPTAGFIEIFIAAALSLGIKFPLQMTAFEIKEALEIKDQLRIQTKIKKMESGYEVIIYSFDQTWKPHVFANVAPLEQDDSVEISPHNEATQSHYQRVAAFGYHYGPHFRTVQKEGHVKTNAKIDAYTVYPPLLDGAFQLSIGSALTLPIRVEKISVFAPLPKEIKVGFQAGNIVVYDLPGKRLLEIKNLEKKVVEQDTLLRLLDKGIDHLFYHEHWQKSKLEKSPSHNNRNWLLVYSLKTPLFEKIKTQLENCEARHINDLPATLQDYDIVNFLPVDEFQKTILLLQAYLKIPDQNRLFITLTKGISPSIGLHRSLKQEFPHCPLIHISIESEEALLEELLYPDDEPEVLLKEDGRYVNRILPIQKESFPRIPYFLQKGTKIEDLAWKPQDKHTLGEEEIEVEAKAVALNFRDVLNALGLYPGESGKLGSDFSGIVKNKGSKVHLNIGDEVFGISPGALQNPIITTQALVAKKSDHLNFIEAASIPIVFLTTYYALIHLAKLKKNDKILIHAASGGVGLAAIQIAKSVGAEIYATVSSEKKKAYLKTLGITHIYSSRSTEYATHLKDMTVVLNSLTGSGFIESSLQVIAKGGCFLELSKRNIWTREEMKSVRPDIRYFIVAIDEMRKNDPSKIQSLLYEIQPVTPLPHTLFPLTQVKSAFHYLQEAKHIGKVVVKFPTAWKDNLSSGTYLIIGGLGGLGMKTAEWLISQGAKKIVLAGRRIPSQLKLPPEISVHPCDITNEDEVAKLLKHPFKGIIHAAGILHNAGFLEHSLEDFEKVLAPKVKGAKVLHEAILKEKLNLDFLVYFSSTSALLGGHGRSAYAAANSFLDQFSKYQQQCGLPAISLAFGAWEEAGMALPHLKQMQKRGTQGLKSKEALMALKQALDHQDPYLAVTATDWNLYIPTLTKDNPRFKLLAKEPLNKPVETFDLYEYLRKVIREILGQPQDYPIDIDESFINQKLDSLNQIEFLAAMEKDLKLKQTLRVSVLQKYSTIRRLGDFLRDNLKTDEKWMPLGTNMEHYWHTQFSQDFNIGRAVCFKEPVNKEKLEKALNAVLKQHPLFYTVISKESPTYKIAPFKELKIEMSACAENYKQYMNQPLDEHPKIRAILCDKELQIICPHSISDGRSLHLFLNELDAAYTNPHSYSSKAKDYQVKFHEYDGMVNENKEQKILQNYIPFQTSPMEDTHELPLKLSYSLSDRQHFQSTCQMLGIESSLALNGLAALALSFITKQMDFSVVYASDGIFSPQFAEVIGPFCKQIPLTLARKKSDTLDSYINRLKENQNYWSYLREFPSSQLKITLRQPEEKGIFSFLKKEKFPLLLGITEIEFKDYSNFLSIHRGTLLDRMQGNKEVVNILSVLIQKEWNLYIAWPFHAKYQKKLLLHLENLITHFMSQRNQKLQRMEKQIKK